MFTLKRLVHGSLFVFVLAGVALAQENRAPVETPRESVLPAAPLVTAAATAERVRFVSPGTVVQVRLEVYNETGQKLFDTELHGGNVLDWHLQNGLGERFVAGSYACVLTLKSLSGRMSQRVGVVKINDKEAAIETAGAAQLTTAQQQTIGPVESNAAITILQQRETEAITTVTHDSAKGQLTSTTGSLAFGTGDVFAGKDKEHMRITEDGRVGIGTDKPEATLDVAGLVRAREGLMFSDGSTLKVNEKGVLTRTSADGTAPSAVSSTQNRLAKFTDNAGTVGDSLAIDTGTGLQLTVAPSGSVDTNLLYLNSTSGTTGMLAGSTPSYGANNGPFFAMRGNTYSTIANQRGQFTIAAGNVSNPLGDDGSVKFNTGNNLVRMVIRPSGNVGIGTNAPGSLLDVGGNINTSTQFNIGGSRVFSIPGANNTFAGINAGNSNTTGFQNSFFGNFAGSANTTGFQNSFFGGSAGTSNTTGASNAFFGYNAGRDMTSGGGNSFFGTDAGIMTITGNFNAFFGNQAGRNNTASRNSFFGQNAGFGNTTGTFNSFFGLEAGFSNNEGFFNSFFGYRAGANTTGPTASANSFFGNQSGEANTSGNSNAFFGASSGQTNSTGNSNAFFGTSAGQFNTTGDGNAFFGANAGFSNTTGINNSFVGIRAGFNNTTAGANSFFGFDAGLANTTGTDNVFVGGFTGQGNTTGNTNTFVGRGVGVNNTTGSFNSFFGASAGQDNTTSCCNSFFGVSAGHDNTTGTDNSFFGTEAGGSNLTGTDNSFFGRLAGTNSTASDNSFFGSRAGTANTSGGSNSFFGTDAGAANTTGGSNIVIGNSAGSGLIAGSNNIYLANAGADESNTIRIGTEGTQTATFIAGINGINVNPSTAVVVNSNGQLGVIVSSQRFKKDIQSMGEASSRLMRLRPVTFFYRPEYVSGEQTLQYGLIAEEVARVYPDLVAFGPDGKPQTVRYHLLSTMLLNEVQKQETHIRSQAQQLQSQAQQIADLQARLRRLEPQASVKRRR